MQEGDEFLDNLILSLIVVLIRKEDLWMYFMSNALIKEDCT